MTKQTSVDDEIKDLIAECTERGQLNESWFVPKMTALLNRARVEWLDEQVSHLLFDIYPTDVFTKPTEDDYKRINDFDANLHTRLHCDGIRHGLHVLRREVRGLSAREDLPELKALQTKGEA